MTKTHSILTVTALLAGVACAPAPDDQVTREAVMLEVPGALEQITTAALRDPIAELSSDAYGGRGPGSEGDAMTRRYLIAELEEIGFEPAGGDGSWEQPFDIVGVESEAPEEWVFSKDGESISLAWWNDYIASSGVQEPSASIEAAELVFVGYGIQAPEYEWDDFKDVDVTGKVLVIMNNDPDWSDDLFEGNRRLYYGRWTYKYEKAAEMGAVGAIIVHTTPSAGYPFQVVQSSWTGPQFEIPAGDEPRLQIPAWTSEDAMYRIFALAGHNLDELRKAARSRDFRPVPLGVVTSLALENTVERVETANVVATLAGRDPELADEHIVYSAHPDHLGIGKPNEEGDEIYNGALDNAAGCAQILAIAKAFAALPDKPRRSIMLSFVAAEEQGLLGSAYFAQNPPVPPGRMAANINYDGGNIWGRNRDVTYIGYGKSSLDAVVEKYAAEQGRTVKPDQFPDRGFFYRSDQFNFAKVGVPAVYLDTGTDFIDRPEGWGKEQIEAWEAVHYHQPSDELEDDWNFEGMIEDAVLGFKIGLHLAEEDEMPTWNEGDEFEAARLAALAARD